MHPPFPVKGQSTSFVLFEIITAVKCAKDLVGLSLSPTDYLNHIHSTVICRLSIKPASWQSPSVCRCRYNYHLLTTFDQSSQPQFGLDSSGILSSFFTTTTTTTSDTTFEALAFSVVKLEVKMTINLSKKSHLSILSQWPCSTWQYADLIVFGTSSLAFDAPSVPRN